METALNRQDTKDTKTPLRGLVVWFVVVLVSAACAGSTQVLYRDDFTDLRQWVVEQMPGGTVTVTAGALVIEDAAGCTVWFRPQLTAPVVISYEATVISRRGPHDRVSDLNCFWMATDPRSPADLFAPGVRRTGKFTDYDVLRTYYTGYGGNDNTTTRFRRYADGEKPLLPEHDLRDTSFLLQPNKTYRIRLVAAAGTAEFWRDNERLFVFRDPAPLSTGWFGLRTVNSHLVIRHLRIRGN